MQGEISQQVIRRFFEAFTIMKAEKVTNLSRFCNENGINRRNLYQLQKDMSRDIFEVGWLSILVLEHGVSAGWLLTGRGPFYEINRRKTAIAKSDAEQGYDN